MNDELVLDGKKYISSKRLAQETGYAGDYISRLCRDGKVDGKLVGRNWYVDLESLITHQKEMYEKKKEYPQLKRASKAEDESEADPATDTEDAENAEPVAASTEILPESETEPLPEPEKLGFSAGDLWDSYIVQPAKAIASEYSKEKEDEDIKIPVSIVSEPEKPAIDEVEEELEEKEEIEEDEDEEEEVYEEPRSEGVSALLTRRIDTGEHEEEVESTMRYEFPRVSALTGVYRYKTLVLIVLLAAGGLYFAHAEILDAVLALSEERISVVNTAEAVKSIR